MNPIDSIVSPIRPSYPTSTPAHDTTTPLEVACGIIRVLKSLVTEPVNYRQYQYHVVSRGK